MWKRIALPLAFAAAFFVVNRGAYRGYFQDDELDTLGWAPALSSATFLQGVVTPRFLENNFRPVGHFFFHAAGSWFGLNFPRYVLGLQLIHLLNVWLLWLLLRKLDAPPLAAVAACLFFGFHMALFDAFWKPMYVYDVLCGTFCLLSLLLYAHGGWVLSFVAFWLAYKSKELAVMLPLALACYEIWFGKRRWKPLVVFFAASLSFGLQGIFLNPNKDNSYTFRFTAAALAVTSVFYAGKVLLVPYLGFAMPLVAWFARSRRVWFGLATMGILFFPLLFLPGRLFSAYCYVPFLGLAVAFAGLAELLPPAALAAFFLLWLPVDYHELRLQRRATLAADDEVRAWVSDLSRFAGTHPDVDALVYDGSPAGFHRWGIEGAVTNVFGWQKVKVSSIDDRGSRQRLEHDRVALLAWDGPKRRLNILSRPPNPSYQPYVQINAETPFWELGEGWYGLEGDYRWIAPAATAYASRPEGARRFELRANVGPELVKTVGPVTVRVALNGVELPPHTFSEPGWRTAVWDLAPAPAGAVAITIRTAPPMPTDDQVLGIALGGLGFRASP